MTRLNGAVAFYEPMELIGIWQELDETMLTYWREKQEEREKREREREAAQSKQIDTVQRR